MHPIWLIPILFVALGAALIISEWRKPSPVLATNDTSIGAGPLTLGIALLVTAAAIALLVL